MVTIHDLRYNYSFDIGYGTLDYYHKMIAKVFGIEAHYELARYPACMQNIHFVSWQTKEHNIEYIYDNVPEAIANFLFASDCQTSFDRKECSELYHLLKDIVLPEDFQSLTVCYGKAIDLHRAFVMVFSHGRYKNNGVAWE